MNIDIEKLAIIYEAVAMNLPPGITSSDIMTIEEYLKEICGDGQTVKEALQPSEDPTVGTAPIKVSDNKMRDIMARRAEGEVLKPTIPYIHKSNIVDEHGHVVDPNQLRGQISQRPVNILKRNKKMKKSSGKEQQFYDISLPAYNGLYIDEKKPNQPFMILRTCPHAGKCLGFCYAKKGGYIQWKATSMAASRVLNFLMNDWQGFKTQLLSEIGKEEFKNSKNGVETVVRWHDAGDFFSDGYLQIAFNIARRTPKVTHYAYTKEFDKFKRADKPSNFVFNISQGGTSDALIDPKTDKNSTVVGKELFKDLLEKTPADEKSGGHWYFSPDNIVILKKRVGQKYDINPKNILTYDEMMKLPYDKSKPQKKQWDVLVWPGHGDQAATRNDIRTTFLLAH